LQRIDPASPHKMNCSPEGRLSAAGVPLKYIIEWAYDIRTEFSTPDWTVSSDDAYTIEAKAAGSVRPGECRVMTQHLLEDRFKLKLHRESKEEPVFFMVAANRGLKLHEVKPDSAPGLGVLLQGHRTSKGWEAWMIATWLGGLPIVGRPVVDKTELKGLFEFSLDYSNGSPNDERPNIFAALQEQLGLKLEPGKAPVEHVVIDRLEKAAVN
jgi:uncharacterized protein (TIGR03435 family)